MTYDELRRANQARINALPIKFAFSDEQFDRAMKEICLFPDQVDQIRGIGFGGGFCHVKDYDRIMRAFDEVGAAMTKAMEDDEFFIQAVASELANHEYIITWDPTDALGALDIKLDNERSIRLFSEGRKRYLEKAKEWI